MSQSKINLKENNQKEFLSELSNQEIRFQNNTIINQQQQQQKQSFEHKEEDIDLKQVEVDLTLESKVPSENEFNKNKEHPFLGLLDEQHLLRCEQLQDLMQQTITSKIYSTEQLNTYLQQHFIVLNQRFETHTETVTSLKVELENVFRRIRNLKTILKNKYPATFQKVMEQLPDVEIEDD